MTRHSARFGLGMPMVIPPPPASSLCRLPVIHTDGNNFFRLLAEVGESCSQPRDGGSVSLLLSLCSVLATEICSSHVFPPAAFPVPRLPLWIAVWPFNFLCFGVFSALPQLSVLVLLCDRDVLVNPVSNQLCVYVCLWGGFFLSLVTRPCCTTVCSLSRPGPDSQWQAPQPLSLLERPSCSWASG